MANSVNHDSIWTVLAAKESWVEGLSVNEILIVLLVVSFAGLVHGAVGIGFPMIATPILAIMTDIQSAILLTLAANIAVNLWSTVHGGNLGESVGRFWPVVIWMLLGSALGTLILIAMDPNPLRLLLAAIIVFYLFSDRLSFVSWDWIRKYPKGSGVGTGITAGLLGGTVNVSGPLTILYLREMRVSPLVMVQTLNLSFVLGKTAQTVTFAAFSLFDTRLLLWSIPIGLMALAGLRVGMMIRARISAEKFLVALRFMLWTLALLLILQFFRDL